ncbi:MAG: HNH endonuclease signature motif containing protein [Pseudomonas sp.]
MKERLLNKSVAGASGCREYTGFIDKDGYGVIKVNGFNQRAHRASYAAFNGPIGEGKVIMHSCDNRSCIEPEHLSEGTQLANVLDCKAKGRMGTRGRPKCSFVEFDESMRDDILNGTGTLHEKAKRHNLPRKVVGKVITNTI